jgi:hypothetical protein
MYCYNLCGVQQYYIEGDSKLPAGTHQVRMEFADDGGGISKGGEATLYADGKQVGSGRVERTEALIFSCDETSDIGRETGSSVTADTPISKFNGDVNWLEVDIDQAAVDADHLISPEERFKVAMMVQ